jgi:hypothetical protein
MSGGGDGTRSASLTQGASNDGAAVRQCSGRQRRRGRRQPRSRLGPETRVVASEGAEGRLVGLAADQYVNRIAALHVGGWRDDEATVPGDRIGELVPEAIRVNVAAADAGRHARSAVSS